MTGRGAAAAMRAKSWDAIVVGAGVFGAWSAEMLRRSGRRVLLLDAWGPAHARASSGGESRLIRACYGADGIYSSMAAESLADWTALSKEVELPLFHRSGVLSFFDRENDYASISQTTLHALGLRVERMEPAALKRRWPQVDWSGVAFGLLEPDFGALMARRAVATLVARFIAGGGEYRQAAIDPPPPGASPDGLKTLAGEILHAEQYVFACGPWLKGLFPDLLGERLFVTRQEIFFFRPPSGDPRFGPQALPGWIDFVGNDVFYGFPDLEGRGFKIGEDNHGPPVDCDANERTPDPARLAAVRTHMARRFPTLAGAPLSESRVCQYENSANGDLLIDRHPAWPSTILVGMGSGHGFKHGPVLGKLVARMVSDGAGAPDPRFSLAGKAPRQNRSVH